MRALRKYVVHKQSNSDGESYYYINKVVRCRYHIFGKQSIILILWHEFGDVSWDTVAVIRPPLEYRRQTSDIFAKFSTYGQRYYLNISASYPYGPVEISTSFWFPERELAIQKHGFYLELRFA